MSGFDKFSKNNFARSEQMKQVKQLKKQEIKKIEPDKQERSVTPQQAQAQETSTAAQTTHQSAEASALEALANQNRGLINIADRGGIASVSFVKDNLIITDKSELIDKQEAHMNTDVVPGSAGGTGTTPTEPTTDETTISNEDIYAGREKYTQETIDSLNIGIDSGAFNSVVHQYFSKVSINGEEVYILKSGTLTQVKDLISQIYAADKLSSTTDYIPDPPEEANGYALLSSSTYESRKASYYYMCYVNGIPYDGHEFENGNFNKEIALACGLYECEDVFANFINNENVQKYLQDNFGITVSVPPSQEHIDLWNKLAKLAAIGGNGENTGEYNKYNVIKYFGLALTDPQFMSFVDKASFEKEENSVLDNSWDIETVKNVISERYPELLENSEVLTDEFLEWIGSNAFEFLLYNQSKLRAGDIQEFVNYGNIPSWITYNNGIEFNKELLLKCCIQSMVKLADIGAKLGYEPKEFVNRELSEFVTEIYTTEVENLESTGATGGPRREQASQGVPDYVLNFMRQKYGANLTYALDSDADWAFYINDEYVGYMAHGSSMIYLSDTKTCNFVTCDYYMLKNGEIIPHTYFDTNEFLGTYYSDMSSPVNEREYFINGDSDFYEMLTHMNFDALCEVMSHLMDPELTGRGETNAKPEDELEFWANLRNEIYSNDTLYSFLFDTISGKIQERGETFLQSLLPDKDTNSDISKLYYLISHRDSDGFGWNADEVLFNVPGAGQQNVGDCWFISFNLGLSQHPELVQLLKDYCLNYDAENEIYTVIIKGESYTFTKAEIMGETELSKDDTELRVLEMAAIKHYGINYNPIIMGGNWAMALTLFTGLNNNDLFDLCNYTFCTGYYDNNGNYINMFEEYEDYIIYVIQSGYMSKLGVGADGYWAIDMETGAKVYLPGNHAYNIAGTDGEFLYIQNPWAGESNKVLRLSFETIKNNGEDFSIESVNAAKLSRAIQDANGIVPNALRDKLESGDYFTENGDFDIEQYYHDCEEWEISPFHLDFMFDKTYDGSKLSIYNPDGTCTIVFKTTSGQIQIIEIGRLTPSFVAPDGVPFDIDNFTDEQLIEELHKSLDDISLFIMSDGTLDRDLLSQVLSKLTVNGWFDATPLMILQYYFRTGDYFDSEGFKDLLSNFNNYDEVERFAKSVLQYEKVKMAFEQPQINPEIIFAHMREFASLTMRRPDGSIYAGEMSYWDWADVLADSNGSTESYIQALNAMNSIMQAAKSIGVSLDAYIHMDPAERERRRGMLTTPINDTFVIPKDRNIEFDENGNVTYYSVSNQSSCISVPDWFLELYADGNMPTTDEIDMNVLLETNSEAEEKLYLERQHYQFWQEKNSSLLEGFSPIEQYNIYQMDMMYFMMWLNTDAILEGYSKDNEDMLWEDFYEIYHESGKGIL